MSNMLTRVQKMFQTKQNDLEDNYLKELEKRSGKEKWDFIVQGNELIEGQSELAAYAAHNTKRRGRQTETRRPCKHGGG